MTDKTILRVASIAGLLSVALGAFGAHGLKALVDEKSLAIFDTATRYQMFHALALLLVAVQMKSGSSRFYKYTAISFILGIIFFSGSLYLLAIRSLLGAELSWLGPITPLGGLFFIMGWIFLFISASKTSIEAD
ncbi:DUF423 domain-containing protein [soil metagenome]